MTKNITVSWNSKKPVEHDHHTDGFDNCNFILYFVALAVYVRSPAAYKALQSFGILNLPSKSTMQAYTGAFMHDPGASSVCIAEQVARYVVFKRKQEPKSDGVLIFDEVKVACQIMWNSAIILTGLAMTSDDFKYPNILCSPVFMEGPYQQL